MMGSRRAAHSFQMALLTLTETLFPRISLDLRGPLASFLPLLSFSARFLMRRVCHEHDFLLYQKTQQSNGKSQQEGRIWKGEPASMFAITAIPQKVKATGNMPISILAMRVEVKKQTKQFCKADVVPHLLCRCMDQEKKIPWWKQATRIWSSGFKILYCIATNRIFLFLLQVKDQFSPQSCWLRQSNECK